MHTEPRARVAIVGGGPLAATLVTHMVRRGALAFVDVTTVAPVAGTQADDMGGSVRHVRASAVDASPRGDGWEVALDTDGGIHAHAVVLVSERLPPAHPAVISVTLRSDPRYLGDPCQSGALATVGDAETVLVLGTGIPALRVVSALQDQGHRAKIVALSQHGLLPLADAAPPYLAAPELRAPTGADLATWVRVVRTALHEATARGHPWQGVIDATSQHLPEIWETLHPRERRSFLEHLGPWWSCHAERVPSETLQSVASLRARGAFDVLAGSLEDVRAEAHRVVARVRRRGRAFSEAHLFDRVINGSDPDLDLWRSGGPLYRNLLMRGHVRQDAQLLGLVTDPAGAALQEDGRSTPGLYLVGAARRPPPWGRVSVHESSAQAASVASALFERLGPRAAITAP